MRHTKIIATVGPACNTDEMLDALIAAGTDIFRLNFSHGTQQTQADTFKRIGNAAKRARREVAVLQDLAGPKIRTGTNTGGKAIPVKPGERLTIATGDFPGEPGRVSTTFAALAQSVRPGDRLLLADGSIELRVDDTNGREIQTTVVEGGEIGEHKGINAPGVPLPASAITPKDADDLKFGLSLGVDMIAVSFVQTAADLRHARQLMTEAGAPDVPLVAKLERPRAQKEITRAARRQGVPVIVATQVLESMTVEARPTRAEVNDAANAVEDGVDVIMLAGETAAGAYPARAVLTLDAIIRDAEAGLTVDPRVAAKEAALPDDHAQALCEAAVTLANRGDADAIVAVTRGGGTARRLSALRPRAPIIATTERDDMARRLAIYWGVVPACVEIGEDVETTRALVTQQLVARGLIAAGSTIVLVSISDDLTRDDANYLKMKRL